MPRTGRSSGVRSEVLSSPQHSHARALLASARNFRSKPIDATNPASQLKPEEWHRLAWDFYDNIGEYRYSVDWKANLLSRAKLVVLQNGEPTTDQRALDALAALYDGPEGQSEMLRQIGRHAEVAGDCFLMGVVPPENSKEEADWLIAAACETKYSESEKTWTVVDEKFPDSKTLVVRIWRPHPRIRRWADSPSRAILPVLAEIDGLTKHVAAQIDSRLAGAGILFVPNEMTFAGARAEAVQTIDPETGDPVSPDQTSNSDPNELVKLLIDVMSAAIADRSDPSALVPIIIQADGDAIKNVRFETFSTTLDAKAIELRSEAIRRLALGLDMPPEILTGTSDMNHWSSWGVEEAALKAHTEPLLAEICDALTTGYLWQAIEGDDAQEFSFGFDSSELRVRPNRSKEAIELYNLGILGPQTVIIENGFDPAAAMTDEEKVVWLLTKIAGGSATPDQVQAALEALGVNLVITPGAAGDTATTRGDQVREDIRVQEDDPQKPIEGPTPVKRGKDVPPGTPKGEAPAKAPAQKPRQSRPDPSIKGHPTKDIPAKKGADTVALAQVGAVMVHRALERAGNKIKTTLNGAPIDPATNDRAKAANIYRFVHLDAASTTVDSLLADAWGSVEVFADDLDVDAAAFTAALDDFTRGLLRERRSLHVAELQMHLEMSGFGDGPE
jgi:hypothetical protein